MKMTKTIKIKGKDYLEVANFRFADLGAYTFPQCVALLRRPYIKISQADWQKWTASTQGDFLYNKQTDKFYTLGSADDGYALMPLRANYQRILRQYFK